MRTLAFIVAYCLTSIALARVPQAPEVPQAPAIPEEVVPTPTPKPEPKPKKTCQCSSQCTCGCNEGLPCICGEVRVVSPATYSTYTPIQVPALKAPVITTYQAVSPVVNHPQRNYRPSTLTLTPIRVTVPQPIHNYHYTPPYSVPQQSLYYTPTRAPSRSQGC